MPNASHIESAVAWLLTTDLIICGAIIFYTDIRYLRIPNSINVALFVGGVLFRFQDAAHVALLSGVAALAVYVLIWLLRDLHLRITGRVGLGLGDVKLIAAATPWLDIATFPVFLFAASFMALLSALVAAGLLNSWRNRRIPFGPFLATSLLLTWSFGSYFTALLETL
jgi:leader peptidase (prepilin peptidase)/N-methyltransferase